MIDEGLRKAVETLACEEMQRANKIKPQFADEHHGYAVIKEEVEEARDELDSVEDLLEHGWNRIKADTSAKCVILILKKKALLLAAEAIQVAAMAQKFIDIQ